MKQYWSGYLLPLDRRIRYLGRYWKIGAIGTGHSALYGTLHYERYYWLTRGKGEVAMVPAFVVEAGCKTVHAQVGVAA